MKNIVNEKTTPVIEMTFKDENGNPVIPDNIVYRIDNEDGTEITPDTSLTPTGSTVSILLSENETRIVNQKKNYERRILTVTFKYSNSTKTGRDKFVFVVKNLSYIL